MCAISQEPFKDPVVACELGHLYNMEALITQHLLSKHKLNQFLHIRNRKDVITCNLQFGSNAMTALQQKVGLDLGSGSASGSAASGSGDEAPYFVCPITSLPGNGKYKFVVMRNCGCVLSERALKEVPSETCLVCHRAIPEDDLKHNEAFIRLNPASHEESEAQRAQMEARRNRLKQVKSAGVEKKQQASVHGHGNDVHMHTDESVEVGQKQKRKLDNPAPAADGGQPHAAKSAKESHGTDDMVSHKVMRPPSLVASASPSSSSSSSSTSSAVASTSATSKTNHPHPPNNNHNNNARSKPPKMASVPTLSDPLAFSRLVDEKVKKSAEQSRIFQNLFLSPEEIRNFKPSQISTKPESSNARL